MPPTPAATPSPRASSPRRVIVATAIGNTLEWFDLTVYGFLAGTIGKLFFPASDERLSLMLALGTFGVSYLARPVGALVLGAYADRRGRRASLLASIALMTLGTAMIALMPPYTAIGLWAPLGILLARLIQGFSVGGEFGSATALLVETAPQRRGFMSSWQYTSQGLTTVMAAACGATLTAHLSPAQLEGWGWRLPFLFGLLIGPVGLYIRRHVAEPPLATAASHASPAAPLRMLFGHQKTALLRAIGLILVSTAMNHLVILYMPIFAVRQLGLPATTGFLATLVAGLTLTVIPPLVGHWSDRIGRTGILAVACSLLLLSVYPAYRLLAALPGLPTLLLVMVGLSAVKAVYAGALPARMAELFPAATRASGLAVAYNVGVSVFGGFAPVVVTWLIDATGQVVAPSYYLMACALLSLLAIAGWPPRLSVRTGTRLTPQSSS